MKSTILMAFGLFSAVLAWARPTPPILTSSPDGAVRVSVTLDAAGVPRYTVHYRDAEVLRHSRLGLQLAEADFSRDLRLAGAGKVEIVTDNYTLLNDKRAACRYQANRRRLRFRGPKGWLLSVIFQVSNDGVAFRYEVEGQSKAVQRVVAEHTTFRLPTVAKGWLHPHAVAQTGWANTQPSYEEYYQMGIAAGTPSPLGQGWSFPALLQVAGHWVLLTETDLDRHYAGAHLSHLAPDGEYGIAFPQAPERTTPTAPLLPESGLPWRTPWRVVIVGPSLGTIVESTLTTDVATPAKTKDTAFVQPGKAAWSWALLKDESAVYEVQKRFIDYAADMKWRYCLIDALWDTQIGYEKTAELARYAHSKNVDLLLWYNSNGSWNQAPQTPLRRLFEPDTRRQEFARLQQMGIKGVKIDFFGGDGQSFMAYYQDLLEDAAAAGLVVNFHGTTIPRGWTRTYPNLVTMEAVRGYEFITFEQANADQQPSHCAMLPFARNAIGPMDFTPLCFSELPGGIRRATTNGFELALSVLFQSGIQHYVEIPEGMARQPAYVVDFLRNLPPRWDDVRLLDGFPGQYAVLARQAQGKWYVAGINGTEKERTVTLDLSKLGPVQGGTLITEGSTSRDFSTRHVTGSSLTLPIKPHGGFVLMLE
ncbi:glycoside hydrolase family 97 protein [Hymenobacter sp. BT18]|uniref:glycoside hydrolase family 97 protein n=1 Tax=Hymenobacter sp. BT18 TaxID=2835648 RepID=UPI00143EECB9|nr:glycoside hydrolase family 97 protein [Hymenobacter sp. BT18]QIX59984.1 glycoside hydrolase family 97 protein [Hymenobacter sp. BT18]